MLIFQDAKSESQVNLEIEHIDCFSHGRTVCLTSNNWKKDVLSQVILLWTYLLRWWPNVTSMDFKKKMSKSVQSLVKLN